MNGAHDMGGMHGFGPVDAEADEPVFHAEWEKRVFALTLAAGAMGRWNIDKSRFARENRPPEQYLGSSYYELWLQGLETLLLEGGLVTAEELASGKAAGPLDNELARRVLRAEAVDPAMSRGDAYRMPETAPARFKAGDAVRVANRHPLSHTRAPRYVRGREGVIDRMHGVFVFADENAQGNKIGEHCYSVCFEARELWGPEAAAEDRVFVDLWDSHLEPRL
tara:strand:+ start:1220 stop:1885 length:666 start_codon:yes stop_codon:yes gene_type:complete